MIGAAIAMLLAGQAAGEPDMYQGRCDYPAELGPARADEKRISCDAAVVSAGRGPNDLLVQFASKSGGEIVGFAGDVDNSGSLAVRRVYLRPGQATPADRGHCRIFRSQETVSGITCVGFVGSKAIVANFRAFAP